MSTTTTNETVNEVWDRDPSGLPLSDKPCTAGPANPNTPKTNDEKILWWVRFIGIVTIIGLVLGGWFGIQAVAAEMRYNQCVEDSYSSAGELRCALER